MRVSDFKDTATFVIFDKEAEKHLGCTTSQLVINNTMILMKCLMLYKTSMASPLFLRSMSMSLT